jgi:hypothetical protein
MPLIDKLKTVLRGDVPVRDLPREFVRRRRVASHRSVERRMLDEIAAAPARLVSEYAVLTDGELRERFRTRPSAVFAPASADELISALERCCPGYVEALTTSADAIIDERRWELAGFGPITFDSKELWRSDPFTGEDWGLEYHADMTPYREGGPDIRVLWELNRLGHLLTLAMAYLITGVERYADAVFDHIDSWIEQNPYGRGANWHCAMEVALRAINVIAAFDIVRSSAACTAPRLRQVLKLLDQHGRFILDNNEFSYVGTSNHYLSDVVGLFWIGTCVPELEHAREWRAFGLREVLNEAETQVLADGADFEASTGYHGFVTELLVYSYLIGRRNGVEMGDWLKSTIGHMVDYLQGIKRPDGRIPLIGDADGSHIVPAKHRDAGGYAYLTDLWRNASAGDGAAASSEPESILWLGVEAADGSGMEVSSSRSESAAFRDAGSYVMRSGELYLFFNANDVGANGRGSHAHNDALSIEICVGDEPFIVDPGSYVYNLDRSARQRFRSTAYHSTVTVDDMEQNTTHTHQPFVMGNEARPKLLSWESTDQIDRVSAEHYGYRRLSDPVTHRRTVTFDKIKREWLVEDEIMCSGEHEFGFRLHFDHGVVVSCYHRTGVKAVGRSGKQLLIEALDEVGTPGFESAFVSRGYGHRARSIVACWKVNSRGGRYRWKITSQTSE